METARKEGGMSAFIEDLRHAVNERIDRLRTEISVGMSDHGDYREKCGRIKEAEKLMDTIQEVHGKYMTHDIDDQEDDDDFE